MRRSSFAGLLGAAARLGTRAGGQPLEVDYSPKVFQRSTQLAKFDDGSTFQEAALHVQSSPYMHPPGMLSPETTELRHFPASVGRVKDPVPLLQLDQLEEQEATVDRELDGDASASPPLEPADPATEAASGDQQTPAMNLPAFVAPSSSGGA